MRIKNKRSVLVILSLGTSVFLLVQCMNGRDKEDEIPVAYTEYAGSEKCGSCHRDVYDKHLKTAHHLTGQPATEDLVTGSFANGSNSYYYSPDILVSMEKRDSGLYQVIYYKGEEKMAIRKDIVIGSGVMGQSFLNWRHDRLYQMPITYFTAAAQWSNSPGFPEGRVMTDRPITARCLECHISYAEGIGTDTMEPVNFKKDKMIYGVSCEKCHGPAARHVAYQINNPGVRTAKFVVNPAKLSRQQQLDVCAVCHAGKMQKIKPSFQFVPGKNLADYFIMDSIHNSSLAGGEVEVHGNQYGLLRKSKCFTATSTMTCSSCHNTHDNERNKPELFSARCMSCHPSNSAALKTPTHLLVKAIEQKCISCHMPALESRAIAVYLQGETAPRAALVRSHFIGLYPDETKKVLTKEK
jgi:Cytochrome c554 and c-prime